MHNTYFDLKQQVLGQVTPKPTEVTRRSALHFPDLNRNLDFLPCETIKITQAKFLKYPCGGIMSSLSMRTARLVFTRSQ